MIGYFLYQSPAVIPPLLIMLGVAILILVIKELWQVTDRNYNAVAEKYFDDNYLDYSKRLDNIIKPVPENWNCY